MNIKNPPTQVPYIVISDGQINKEQLSLSGKTEELILEILSSQNVKHVKDVIVMTIDKANKTYLQTKNNPRINFTYGGGQ